jgi:excisionase family DNA binding protein
MQTDVFKTREAAGYIQFGESTLERMRLRGDGPPFIKAGKSVRYRKADLDAWMASRLVRSTSEAR